MLKTMVKTTSLLLVGLSASAALAATTAGEQPMCPIQLTVDQNLAKQSVAFDIAMVGRDPSAPAAHYSTEGPLSPGQTAVVKVPCGQNYDLAATPVSMGLAASKGAVGTMQYQGNTFTLPKGGSLQVVFPQNFSHSR